jgi:tRNA threonylcarbamoyladenosine biosynthesis protein TsaE
VIERERPETLCTLGLRGALGAGKTAFVQGLASGFGIDPVHVSSPTFTICNEYPLAGGGVLAHLDLYRIESEGELEATGFLDLLEPGNVLAVEWADRLPGVLPAERFDLEIERLAASTPGLAGAAEVGDATSVVSARRLQLTNAGVGARERLVRWTEALDATLQRG